VRDQVSYPYKWIGTEKDSFHCSSGSSLFRIEFITAAAAAATTIANAAATTNTTTAWNPLHWQIHVNLKEFK
jgi:hypothetical protein